MIFRRGWILVLLCLAASATPGIAASKHGVNQEDVGMVNALRYAATSTARNSTTLAEAVSKIGSARRMLFFDTGTWTLTASASLPRTLGVWIPAESILNVGSGQTLTIAGPVRIDGCDVFTGTGAVVFGPLVDVDPCWFGAKGDGTTDDTVALQRAIVSAGVSGLRLRAGTFVISSALTLGTGGGMLRGAGHGPFGATKITTTSPTADMLMVNVQGVTISDLQLDASVTRTAGAGIHIDHAEGSSQNTVIERNELLNQYIGIYQQRAALITVRDNIIVVPSNTGIGVLISNTNNSCDANTGSYHGNNLFGPSNTSVTSSRGIWLQAGGGLILTANQVFGFGYNVYMSPDITCTTVPLSEFRIIGNNLDGFTLAGIYLIAGLPLSIVSVSITGNNICPVGAADTEAIVAVGAVGAVNITGGNNICGHAGAYGIHMFGDGTTVPYLNYIGGNILTGNGATAGVSVNVGSTLIMPNVISGFATPYAVQGAVLRDGFFTLATLPNPALVVQGSEVACLDCGPTSATDATCTTGTGRKAYRAATVWVCP